MITDAILGFLLALASFVVGLLPTAEPLGIGSFSGIWRGYAFLNGWLPITEVLAAVGLYVAFMLSIYAAMLILTVWRLLPFKFS